MANSFSAWRDFEKHFSSVFKNVFYWHVRTLFMIPYRSLFTPSCTLTAITLNKQCARWRCCSPISLAIGFTWLGSPSSNLPDSGPGSTSLTGIHIYRKNYACNLSYLLLTHLHKDLGVMVRRPDSYDLLYPFNYPSSPLSSLPLFPSINNKLSKPSSRREVSPLLDDFFLYPPRAS